MKTNTPGANLTGFLAAAIINKHKPAEVTFH